MLAVLADELPNEPYLVALQAVDAQDAIRTSSATSTSTCRKVRRRRTDPPPLEIVPVSRGAPTQGREQLLLKTGA
jgi:hypothetical protein